MLIIILRHLPEASLAEENAPKEPDADKKLLAKGLPAIAVSKAGTFIRLRIKKAWNFILEAKDLKPHAFAGYRMKKLFGKKQPAPVIQPIITNVTRNEQYFLEMIKLQPKNLASYDALGKYYLDRENYSDGKDIYLYLTNHQPANPDFQARLAYCYYQTKKFAEAAAHYEKAIALDSTQPNRYYNLGLSLEGAGNWPEAVKSFDQAIALEPNNPKYYIGLSNSYMHLGNKGKAKEALLSGKEIDPGNPAILAKLGKIH